MFIGQLFEADPMEKDLSPWNIYKGDTEDSMFHVIDVMTYHRIQNQIWGTSSHQK